MTSSKTSAFSIFWRIYERISIIIVIFQYWCLSLLTLLNIRRGADQAVTFDLRFLTYCNVKKGVWVLKEKMKFNIAKKNYKMGNNGRLSNKVQIFPVLHIMEVTFFSSYMYYTRVSEGDNLKKELHACKRQKRVDT